MDTKLNEEAKNNNHIDPCSPNIDVDALIVGAGFSRKNKSHFLEDKLKISGGIACLKALRDRGLNAVIYEATDGLGGTWQRSRYPGARVDIEVMSLHSNSGRDETESGAGPNSV